jgi:hypothetical protein
MSPAVRAYEDEIVNGALASCLAKSKEIGGIVEQHVSHSFLPAISSALSHSMTQTPDEPGYTFKLEGMALTTDRPPRTSMPSPTRLPPISFHPRQTTRLSTRPPPRSSRSSNYQSNGSERYPKPIQGG